MKIEENYNISDYSPRSPELNGQCNKVAYVVIDRKHLSRTYQDLTGRFPYKSGQGNEYILVGYYYGANCILAQSVKNRTVTALTEAWQILHNKWTKVGVAPDVWVLDNEKSKTLIEGYEKNNVQYQLVPPHSHRRNLAEQAIQTFKNHFKAGMATCDPNFSLSQ